MLCDQLIYLPNQEHSETAPTAQNSQAYQIAWYLRFYVKLENKVEVLSPLSICKSKYQSHTNNVLEFVPTIQQGKAVRFFMRTSNPVINWTVRDMTICFPEQSIHHSQMLRSKTITCKGHPATSCLTKIPWLSMTYSLFSTATRHIVDFLLKTRNQLPE